MDFHTLLSLWILSIVGLCSCQNEVLLDGPLNGTLGGSVVFTLINPPSPPPARFTWVSPSAVDIITVINDIEFIDAAYTGRVSVNHTTVSLQLSNLILNDTGEYTLSFGAKLGKTSLTVFGPLSTVGPLSPGAIAGIVIGLIIILAAVSGLAFYFVKEKGKMDAPKPHQARANNDSVELDYADINHFQRKNVQRFDQENGGNGETLYSGVRLPNSQAGPNSSQGPTHADLNFPSNAVGMRAVRPKGQAPGPPMQVPDVTYAQVKK